MNLPRNSIVKPGFTLVEVMISASLGAVLLVGLWTVFDIFSALQERAGTQSRHAQLTRGLLHQLLDDLNRVTMPAASTGREQTRTGSTIPAADSTSGISPGVETTPAHDRDPNQAEKPIVFQGSNSWIILDLPCPADGEDKLVSAANFEGQVSGIWETVPSLRRVIYQFVPPELAILRDSVGAGLTRWELTVPPPETPELIAELTRGEWGAPNSIVWQANASLATNMDSLEPTPRTDLPPGVEREQVPEIERFLFRYSDGSRWRTTWDSRREEALPCAVECLMIWRDDDDVKDVTDANRVNGIAPQVETQEPAEIRAQLDEIRLLDAWNNLGEQDFSLAPAQLPNGFSRYVFCLPASLPVQRQLLEMPDVVTTGGR